MFPSKRWLVMGVAVPVAVWLLEQVADRIEDRRGESPWTRSLRWPQEQRRRAAA